MYTSIIKLLIKDKNKMINYIIFIYTRYIVDDIIQCNIRYSCIGIRYTYNYERIEKVVLYS